MNSIKNKKIAIIGAGPGGLTLARLLQIKGADVKVYERDLNSEARAKGATLDLHEESGLAALEAAGLMHEFRANYRPGAEALRIMDKHAHIVFEDSPKTESNNLRPEIDRGPLQKILLESLEPGTVVWDCNFESLVPKDASWIIFFKNGSFAFADIVIAADGANSRVRPYITPTKPFYAGVTAIEGAVLNSAMQSPKMHAFVNGGKIFAMGDEKSLIAGAKGDGSMAFYATIKTDEFWTKTSGIDFTNKTQVLDWFKKEYNGWDSVYDEIFENASGAFIPRPQYCMPLDQSWPALPNITMLGDAAHLMPPFAGEGVNMAMLDALELSICLTGEDFPSTAAAIRAFEDQMRLRASATAKDTLEATAALHSPDAIAYMAQVIS